LFQIIAGQPILTQHGQHTIQEDEAYANNSDFSQVTVESTSKVVGNAIKILRECKNELCSIMKE